MSDDQPEFVEFDPSMIFAAVQQQQNTHQMHSADFKNRWHELLKEAPIEMISTLEEMLGIVTSGGGKHASNLGNFFEGQCHAVLVLRAEPLEDFSVPTGTPHQYIQADDPTDPYCTRPGCGLPLGNQVHVK